MAIDLCPPAFVMKVKSIEDGSPAAATGALRPGQIIDTINGQKLKDIDPRIQLGSIVTAAEATDGNVVFAMQAAAALTPGGEQSIYADARDVSAMKSFYSTSYMLHGHTGGGIGEVWRSAAVGLVAETSPEHYRRGTAHVHLPPRASPSRGGRRGNLQI